MKNKYLNILVIVISSIFFIEIILNNQMVYSTINNSVDIWLNVLIPSLFPFFIISDILIDYNIIGYIPKKIRNFLCKIFNISQNGVMILFLSMISGFPSNARNARTLYDKNLISCEEASKVLMFTHFSNPLFILTTVGLVFLHNKKLGIVVLLAHFISNIILGILVRGIKVNTNSTNYEIDLSKKNFGTVLTNSIKHALDTLFLIFGTLTVFLVIASIVINRFNIGSYGSMILKGILEMTIGLKDLAGLNISDLYKVVISTMFISFGGLSVHMQVISQIIGTDIKYRDFLVGRIYQVVISGFLAYVFYQIMIL